MVEEVKWGDEWRYWRVSVVMLRRQAGAERKKNLLKIWRWEGLQARLREMTEEERVVKVHSTVRKFLK
jgi:hypothetical protein